METSKTCRVRPARAHVIRIGLTINWRSTVNQKNSNQKVAPYVIWAVATLATVLFFYFIFAFSFRWFWFRCTPIEQIGQWGDSFGFVNSLFSALAFAAVSLALFIQISEYKLAQVERLESIELQEKTAEYQFAASLVASINTSADLRGKPTLWRGCNIHDLDSVKERFLHLETLNEIVSVFTEPNATKSIRDAVASSPRLSDVRLLANFLHEIGFVVIQFQSNFNPWWDNTDKQTRNAEVTDYIEKRLKVPVSEIVKRHTFQLRGNDRNDQLLALYKCAIDQEFETLQIRLQKR